MAHLNAIQLLAGAVTVAMLGLSATATASLAAEGVDVYVKNSCSKGLNLWYEWIENDQVQGLRKLSLAPGETAFVKTTPYRWYRAYAKVWGGGYEWDGSGSQYSIDGSLVRMREYDLNEVGSGGKYTINYPCSNMK